MDRIYESIVGHTANRIEKQKRRLKHVAVSLKSSSDDFFKDHHRKLIQYQELLRRQPFQTLKESHHYLIRSFQGIKHRLESTFQQEKIKLKGYHKVIDIAHPINTMKRGFSILRQKNGKIVRSIEEIQCGECLDAHVPDGSISTQVTHTKKGEAWQKSNTAHPLKS